MKNQCLLYVPEYITEEKELYKFFYKILTAQGKDKGKIFTTASLFACNYGLFHGMVSREQYDKSIQRLKPSDSCENFIKKAPYSKIEIKEHACYLCEYSKAYRNARLQDENIVLRYLLRSDTAFVHCCLLPETMFVSLKRMARDEIIGTCPIIPFNFHLYVFITVNQNKKFQKEELIKEFTDYLLRNEPKLSSCQTNEVYERVSVYINDIYRVPEDSCDSEHFNISRSKLDVPYTYNPPAFTKPEFCESFDKKPTKEQKKRNSFSDQTLSSDTAVPEAASVKVEIIDIPPEDIKTQSASTDLLDTYQEFCMKLSAEDESDASSQESQLETTEDTPMEPLEDTELILDELPRNTSDYEETALSEPMPAPTEITDSLDTSENGIVQDTTGNSFGTEIISLELKTDTESDTEKNETDKAEESLPLSIENKCHFVQNKYIDICDVFKTKILFLCEDMLHSYAENAYKSEFISLEPCRINQWDGLILYLSHNQGYYFFDSSVLTPELLFTIFKNFEGVALTFHPDVVYSMLGYCQTDEPLFHNLSVLAELHGCDSSSEYAALASIGEVVSPHEDILSYILPLYKKLYDNWTSNIDLSMAAIYEKSKKITLIMAKSLDLSALSPKLSPAYEKKGLFQYSFMFDMSQRFTQPGILIGITIKNPCYTKSELPYPFSSEIIYQLGLLHNTYISNVFILNIKNDNLFLYYNGSLSEARRFYDSYLALLQKAFMEVYKEPLQTTTSCIGYGYH